MKKDRLLIMSLTVVLYLSFGVTSTSAAPKERHHRYEGHRVVQKVRAPAANKKIRRLSTKPYRYQGHWESRRVCAPAAYKKTIRHSQRNRYQGRWELRRLWVPHSANYKKVIIPGYYNRWGKQAITQWIRIADRPGYWAETWVWVTTW